jgi:ABC-type uncharacterized transport system permease subunit
VPLTTMFDTLLLQLASILHIRFVKREKPSRWMSALTPIAAIVIALLLAGLLSFVMGLNPLRVYAGMIEGILASRDGISEVLVKMSPILLCALGVGLAYKASFWNIGAEGQIYIGAIFAFGTATLLGNYPSWIVIPLVLVAGFLGGGLWGAIPAILKVRFSANEIVSTLMMNYIAQFGLYYLVHGPWKMPEYMYPWSWPIPASAELPRLPGTRIHLGLVFALIALVVVYLLVKRTFFGYEIRFIGANRDAARAGGINVARTMIIMMLISGGLSGIAGMAEVTGMEHRLKEEISLGYGFHGMTAALLGRLNPLGIALAALVLSILIVGGQYVQRSMSLPSSFVDIILALVVLLLLVGWFASEYRLEIQRE